MQYFLLHFSANLQVEWIIMISIALGDLVQLRHGGILVHLGSEWGFVAQDV